MPLRAWAESQRPRRIAAVGSAVPPRAGSGAGRFADGGRGGPSPRLLAELRSQVTLRGRGRHVAGRLPARATTLPPTASVRRASSGSLPNPRLLLTGAFARRSRANDFLLWGCAAAPHAPAAEGQAVRRTSHHSKHDLRVSRSVPRQPPLPKPASSTSTLLTRGNPDRSGPPLWRAAARNSFWAAPSSAPRSSGLIRAAGGQRNERLI